MEQAVAELAALASLPTVEVQGRDRYRGRGCDPFAVTLVPAASAGGDHEPSAGDPDEAECAEPADVGGRECELTS